MSNQKSDTVRNKHDIFHFTMSNTEEFSFKKKKPSPEDMFIIDFRERMRNIDRLPPVCTQIRD